MSKYDPLTNLLNSSHSDIVAMTFVEIEHQLGFPLPASSRNHRAWWSNNPSNNVMTKAWIKAGYISEEVDIENERLVFRRNADPEAPPMLISGEHPLFGALKGRITVSIDFDLTSETGEAWEAEQI